MDEPDFPLQVTNPAIDLYNFWYGIVKYHAPHLLSTPCEEGEPCWRFPAAFKFSNGHTLHVDRSTLTERRRPMLYTDAMKIWPNGHFIPQWGLTRARWANDYLKAYEEMTFLRWGYVGRSKAVWVQDTPRRGFFKQASERNPPREDNFKDRVPYLPLDYSNLWVHRIKYRLKKTPHGYWVIAAAEFDSDSRLLARSLVRAAQEDLDKRYGYAEKRYQLHERRAELAKLRAAGVPVKPRKPQPEAERAEIEAAFINSMIVWEPKHPTQGMLPFEQEVTCGNDMESRSMAG